MKNYKFVLRTRTLIAQLNLVQEWRVRNQFAKKSFKRRNFNEVFSVSLMLCEKNKYLQNPELR